MDKHKRRDGDFTSYPSFKLMEARMKEQDYQRKIVKYLESRGAYVVKVISASKKGVPDVISCYKGKFIAIEVKTPTTMKNTSKLQEYNLAQIDKANGFSIVAYDTELLKAILDSIDTIEANTNAICSLMEEHSAK